MLTIEKETYEYWKPYKGRLLVSNSKYEEYIVFRTCDSGLAFHKFFRQGDKYFYECKQVDDDISTLIGTENEIIKESYGCLKYHCEYCGEDYYVNRGELLYKFKGKFFCCWSHKAKYVKEKNNNQDTADLVAKVKNKLQVGSQDNSINLRVETFKKMKGLYGEEINFILTDENSNFLMTKDNEKPYLIVEKLTPFCTIIDTNGEKQFTYSIKKAMKLLGKEVDQSAD